VPELTIHLPVAAVAVIVASAFAGTALVFEIRVHLLFWAYRRSHDCDA
jgi:hypothetical protein